MSVQIISQKILQFVPELTGGILETVHAEAVNQGNIPDNSAFVFEFNTKAEDDSKYPPYNQDEIAQNINCYYAIVFATKNVRIATQAGLSATELAERISRKINAALIGFKIGGNPLRFVRTDNVFARNKLIRSTIFALRRAHYSNYVIADEQEILRNKNNTITLPADTPLEPFKIIALVGGKAVYANALNENHAGKVVGISKEWIESEQKIIVQTDDIIGLSTNTSEGIIFVGENGNFVHQIDFSRFKFFQKVGQVFLNGQAQIDLSPAELIAQ